MDDHLVFDIGFALRGPVRGARRALTEDERRRIAAAVVAHLRLCGWRFTLSTPQRGHGAGVGGVPSD